MSATTTNYGLYLNDDDMQKFKNWREQMNGTVDSNIIKIDAILGDKADKNHEHDGYSTVTNLENGSAVGAVRGIGTTAEDSNYTMGENAFAEGRNTKARGYASHAEGYNTTASGINSHVEGNNTIANSKSQHVQGEFNIEDTAGSETTRGTYAHIVGNGTSTSARSNAHTLDWSGNAWFAGEVKVGGTSAVDGITLAKNDLTNVDNAVFKTKIENSGFSGGISNMVNGSATGSVRGIGTTAESSGYTMGQYAFAEGNGTEASGNNSHAEGFGTQAITQYSHAEGYQTLAEGSGAAHAEGANTIANGYTSHAEGNGAQALGNTSHAEGRETVASTFFAHAEGYMTSANGQASHAEGYMTKANGGATHSEGCNTEAQGWAQHTSGKFNVLYDGATDDSDTTGSIFIVGVGTSDTSRANAFRITNDGKCMGQSSFSGSGADYAEYFEWQDGNPDDGDRRGLFVTLNGNKIRIATSDDDYILGVVSATPFVIGNAYTDMWHGMYLKDIFGERLTKTEQIPQSIDEQTGITIPEHTVTQFLLNPEYNHMQGYLGRDKRKEWAPVGTHGQLVIVDDGTCEVDGYCKVGQVGKGTKSDNKTPYRVMERLDETHIRVFIN